MFKNLLLAASCALLVGVVTFSCGGGNKNLCVERNVSCESPLLCDPGDGVCKCGGRGGVVCGDGFVCDAVANTCQSTRCAKVDCTDKPGTSCDVIDGTCKCGGTGGVVCALLEVCNPNARACVPRVNCGEVACPRNQTCDEATGHCRCGGAECAAGQACSVDTNNNKTCTDNPCTGVTCTGANVCDSSDGYCKCNGIVCQTGEACSCPAGADGGCADNQRSCQLGSACAGVTCNNGTTCDPVDGQCKCGGPGGPVCASNQICALGPPAQCQGGQQCSLPDGGPKTCSGGTSCDPEDGKCKCGGRGGVVCDPGGPNDAGVMQVPEVCVQNPVQVACRRQCDVVSSPVCPVAGTYCYFDSSAATPTSYCAAPTDSREEELGCTTPTACFSTVPAPRALHCNGLALGQTGICRAYCDVSAGTAGCLQVPRAQTCVQINGAPTNVGYCQPQ